MLIMMMMMMMFYGYPYPTNTISNESALSDHERRCRDIDKDNDDPCYYCQGVMTKNCDSCSV
jgi:hypothetical protein